MSIINLLRQQNKPSILTRRNELDPYYMLQTDINKLFNTFLSEDFMKPIISSKGANIPLVNIIDSKDKITVKAELPGIDQKDIDISFNDKNQLTIQAKREEEKNEEEHNIITKEQSYGIYERIITLPDEIDTDKTTARFDKGILVITIPKNHAKKANIKRITIQS